MRACLAAIALSAMTLCMPPIEALAQSAAEPEFQGAHRDWRVFTRGSGDERVCYALSRPTESLPSNVDHGQVFFLVSSWASGAAENQPNFLAGYPLRPDSPPRVRVGSDRFQMFVSEQEGFLEQPSEESQLVRAMRRGSDMRVEATSTQGTATAYTFSLRGVTAALQQANQICG